MSDAPPPSLLITPDTRRRLQQRYEEAVRLAGRQPCDFARVHDLLAECLRTDPGNILYLDALLANLRYWGPKPKRSWLAELFGPARATTRMSLPSTPNQVLSTGPDLLKDHPQSAAVLRQLAQAAGECDLDEAELRYLFEARRLAADDVETLRQLARALTRQGRFEEAAEPWQAVLALDRDAEAEAAVADLQPAVLAAEQPESSFLPDADSLLRIARELRAQKRFAAAEYCLARAQQASGGDLALLAEREDLRLAHSRARIQIARQRAASDPHPKAQALVSGMEQEHNRLEIDILHIRSERHPDERSLRLELARRLKKAGNYSGAIQRLEEALADTALAAAVNLELGECWQHLRQFGKALKYYRRAVDSGPTVPVGHVPAADAPFGSLSGWDRRTTLVGALYRIGVLAAAMDQPAEANAALTRLVAIEPEYKDARERLDKLP